MIKRLPALVLVLAPFFFTACKDTATESPKYAELTGMDSSIKPGDNFYYYVNKKWLDTTNIPGTETGVGAFLDVYNRTKDHLKIILDSVSKASNPDGSIEQKVGDFYASAMDSATIEKLGYDPVKPWLKKVDDVKDAKDVMQLVAELQTLNDNVLFSEGVGADEKNSARNIAIYSQGGLGLPGRDYYFKNDPASLAIIKAYQQYMHDLFTLTGTDPATATKQVAAVYGLEKQIAGSHRTPVELRDPQSNYNKFAVADLNKQEPTFGWSKLLPAVGINTDSVNVQQPAFYKKVDELLKTTPIDTWKAYLKFNILATAASALSSPFVDARFNYVKAITGQQKMKPRWERSYRATDANLGEALGQLYVKKYFTEDDKKRVLDLVNNLQTAFDARISHLDWMSDSTKQIAKAKLHVFLKKIGYPDKWRDYSKVTINKATYFDNIVSASKNEYQFQISKVGKPVDRTEWGMTPPTINAYYNPSFNEIVFPAGILQAPFFDPNADDAVNYGAIGMVIGHEMTHGFDDQGAQYDKDGNLKNWWSKDDSVKFVAKSKQVIDQYDGFTVLDTVHLKGALTTGENMADMGGIALAYDAFKMTPEGKDTAKINGLTPDQRFFIALALVWREKLKPETQRLYATMDPHSPAMYRVNGPLENFDPFYKAFDVKPGDKMYKADSARIRIW